MTLVLIASVPGHYLTFAFDIFFISLSEGRQRSLNSETNCWSVSKCIGRF